jgi:tetratricopeptide (TPR) repeat protein
MPKPAPASAKSCEGNVDPVTAAEVILRQLGPRAITLLSSPRTLDDGRKLPARLSANDCYVALEEACRKMARVAVRKFQAEPHLAPLGFAQALAVLFPDPVAYLTRCIRSVVSDAERAARREMPTVSLDQPLAAEGGATEITLGDTFASTDETSQPEAALLDKDARAQFRTALAGALKAIPKNYLEALRRDIDRERERIAGNRLPPESDRDRQTVCRARAALAQIVRRECSEDNPFVHLLAQQRSSRVRPKQSQSQWSSDRQADLFHRLMQTSWTERAAAGRPDAPLEEAVINEVNVERRTAAPSPEMRRSMRVMDTYTLGDNPVAGCATAQALYQEARTLRTAGSIQEAISHYRAAYEQDPTFFAAYNEVGVLLSQLGNLRDALRVYLTIVEKAAGDDRCIAATNAADIHLTWFDAGRNRERNIERATYFAQMAMERPTPMRVCNLILAYVKDRYYIEAKQLLNTALQSNWPACTAEKCLNTLFQVRDPQLISWWNWLDSELSKDSIK